MKITRQTNERTPITYAMATHGNIWYNHHLCNQWRAASIYSCFRQDWSDDRPICGEFKGGIRFSAIHQSGFKVRTSLQQARRLPNVTISGAQI